MKKLILILTVFYSVFSFAGEKLVPLTQEQLMVNASLVTSSKKVVSKDGRAKANLLTVYRGSAAGLSSIIVSFADSLEGANFSFEFFPFLGDSETPKNIVMLNKSNDVYHLSFDVYEPVFDEMTGEVLSTEKTIKLLVEIDDNGNYQVESL